MRVTNSPVKQQKTNDSTFDPDDQIAAPALLISVKQAAKALGVSQSHFYAEVLPYLETVKIGARNLVCRKDLERFIAARKKPRSA